VHVRQARYSVRSSLQDVQSCKLRAMCWGSELTFGCRLYFRLVATPVALAPVVDTPTGFSLPSVADSSPLRYEPSTLVALASATGRGRSEVCPRDSAIALWSFYITRLVLIQ
jgi:hypothetical protein